jgi:phospholipid/cholesterol/gamma-HCH transport system substrate-binding protein
METKANHVLVGAFTLAAIVMGLLFMLWASKSVSDASWQEYEVVFTGAVTGLSEGGAVRFNGIPVGTVRELRIDPDNPRRVLARIRVSRETPVKTDTTAQLRLSGMTGITFILLTGGNPDSPDLAREGRGALPRIMADTSALEALVAASEGIAAKTNTAIERILEFLSEDNARNIGQSLENLELFTGALADQRASMEQLMVQLNRSSASLVELLDSANQLTARLTQSVEKIDGTVADVLPGLSADLQAAAQAMATTLARADRIMAENEAALAAFGAEGLSQLGPTLQELRVLVRDLSRIGARFERNPANFLLGREPLEEYQPQ